MKLFRLIIVAVIAFLWLSRISSAGAAEFTSTWSDAGDVDSFLNRSGYLRNTGQDGNPGGFLRATRDGGVNVTVFLPEQLGDPIWHAARHHFLRCQGA